MRQGAFASLGEDRFFIRCLLPVPVEGYGAWSVGLWVEVTKADFVRAREVWGDAERYAELRFTGVLANDVAADVGLPVPVRAAVTLHVRDVEALPEVDAAESDALAGLFAKPWAKDDFEAYAVERGFL